jgi:hypothetical protein
MEDYYLNTIDEKGIYLLHKENCPYLPSALDRIRLGLHPTCHRALIKAMNLFKKSDGCSHCCRPCHIEG